MMQEEPPVSREVAAAIADELLRSGLTEFSPRIRSVVSLAELQGRSVPRIYGFDQERLSEMWIAYVELPSPGGMSRLGSSQIMLISKETGRIEYVGSAHD